MASSTTHTLLRWLVRGMFALILLCALGLLSFMLLIAYYSEPGKESLLDMRFKADPAQITELHGDGQDWLGFNGWLVFSATTPMEPTIISNLEPCQNPQEIAEFFQHLPAEQPLSPALTTAIEQIKNHETDACTELRYAPNPALGGVWFVRVGTHHFYREWRAE